MAAQIVLVIVVGILAAIPLAGVLRRRPIAMVAAVGLIGGIAAIEWRSFRQATLARIESDHALTAELPHLERETEYVSSHTCRSCHPSQHASWHRTYHRTMTQVAKPGNVVGEFDGSTVWSDGLAYTVTREGDAYWADMPDPDVMMYVVQGGMQLDVTDIPRVRRRVVMTTGSHHYQTYWVGSVRYDRLLQTLPLVYLIRDQRWIPREAAFMRAPLADTERFITQWNHHCIRCHSTGGVPGLDKETGMLDTRVGELGIACEACHGPGQAHVRANRDPMRRYRLHLSGDSDPTIVHPAKLDHRASSQVCGQCHGVYIMRDEFAMDYAYQGALYRPGEDLDRTRYYVQHPREGDPESRWDDLRRNPEFFRERWWDDGTILAGGREYTAMAVTGCYTRGTLSCLSCHAMHDSDPVDQLKPGMRENTACTQCHQEAPYTTDLTSHTHHAADSSGSNCLNCHMPFTTYALLGAIRNHQIAAPSLSGSVRHGVPNACNLCHLDQTLGWTQEHLSQWYGHEKLSLTPEQSRVSAALLWMLKGHAAQRVIAAWHVGWGPAREASGIDWPAPFVARLLADPYGAVRYVAAYTLRTLPRFEDFASDFLADADEQMRDSARAVRHWRDRQTAPPTRTGDHVLLREDGTIMEPRVQALLQARDNRPVTIKE